MAGAVLAAIDRTARLHTVADDHASAVRAARRHGMDRAFEGIERAGHIALGDREAVPVSVSADVAGRHSELLNPYWVSIFRYAVAAWP